MSPATVEVTKLWVMVGTVIMNIGVGIYAWMSNRDKARSTDLKEIKADAQAVENRVTRLEAASISHEELGKVYARVNDLAEQVSLLAGSIHGLKSGVDMIHQHLLSSGGGE